MEPSTNDFRSPHLLYKPSASSTLAPNPSTSSHRQSTTSSRLSINRQDGESEPARATRGVCESLVLAVDLLNPSPAAEARKHKLKTLVPAPRSFFMDVKCPGCFTITTVFSHANTVVVCQGCSQVLCQPTGGKARLTEGCSFRRKGVDLIGADRLDRRIEEGSFDSSQCKSHKNGSSGYLSADGQPFSLESISFLFGMVFQLSCICMWEERWHLRAFGLVVQGEDRFAIEDT
ncbi:40s ribosomal protein s27 [Stemphylium lycopersici]|uniref:40S ribosomal protein S27 n=1 Tax=Stemphylium lycopersici TaxID=183478 RepID=A0A364NE75_STELY|nr:40s ribosomal protein s27 [Stemphylium lycopersici]RAR10864.1 40s ribosomal protein s27 [Stemphylium lycopersici]RAR15401.1 40s ribosomal protein s27 [Stemphylium lycopersici]